MDSTSNITPLYADRFVNDEHRELHKAHAHHPSRRRLELFQAIKSTIVTDAAYWAVLRDAWDAAENIGLNFAFHEIFEFFYPMDREPNHRLMMTKTEQEIFDALPDTFTVYRGVGHPHEINWCWTLDINVANWFARRFRRDKPGWVLTGTVEKDNCIAYLNDRDEQEIITDPEQVDSISAVQVEPEPVALAA